MGLIKSKSAPARKARKKAGKKAVRKGAGASAVNKAELNGPVFLRGPLMWDPWLLLCWGCLLALGVIMVGSASVAVGEPLNVGATHFLQRHLIFVGMGLVLATIVVRVNLSLIEATSQLLLLLCFVLLLLVWIPGLGYSVKGSARWIELGISRFQVVEAVKLMLILYLAGYIVRHEAAVRDTFAGMLKPLVVTGLIAVLLLGQPDFGSAFLLLVVATVMIWLGGARSHYIAGLGVIAVPLLILVARLEPYRLRRLKSFIDPWADPYADGFQLTQALIAVGRGEWFGVGLGGSIQKLFYLPEAHTDFIVAVLAEEFGFVGLVVLVALMGGLVGRCLWLGLAALERGHRYAGYCAYGIGLWLGLQAFICMGVNLGILPTKGITFPFLSSGGSSIMMCCVALGIVLRISHDLSATAQSPSRTSRRKASASAEAAA